jgi:anthranilate phosphoribosyltransferase
VQAAGGVPELAPDKPTRVSRVDGDVVTEPETLDPRALELPYPVEAPPEVASAEALAELNLAVLETPRAAPAGAVRMALLTASTWRWVAGLAEAPLAPATLEQLIRLLEDGAGTRTLQALRSSYTS